MIKYIIDITPINEYNFKLLTVLLNDKGTTIIIQ